MAVKMPNSEKFRSMSAKAIGQLPPFVNFVKPEGHDPIRHGERRRRVRARVRWTVLFRQRHGEALESVTENLSSQGFYCLSQTPIASGEVLPCWLTIPTYDPSAEQATVILECRVRVLRSEAGSSAGLYGLACRIEDYHLACGDPNWSLDHHREADLL